MAHCVVRYLSGLYSEVYNYNHNYSRSPKPQQWGGDPLPFQLTLAFDYSASQLILAWDGVKTPLSIDGGELSVKAAGSGPVVWTLELWKGNFPPTSSGSLRSEPTSQKVRDAYVTLTTRPRGESEWSRTELAGRAATSFTSRQPNNICFTFPRTSLKLWANEAVLRDASPYFKTLFSSDFPEGKPSDPSSTTTTPISPLPAYTYDESDEETDTLATPTKENTSSSPADLPACKVVHITDASYSPYFAVLVWIATGSISFAPLLSKHSTFPSSSNDEDVRAAKRSRHNAVVSLGTMASSLLPPAVSPKSVYRLAHFLELHPLASLALSNFSSQLTTHNAFHELYSDVSCAYEDVRKLVLDYVVANWKEVKDSKALKEVEEKAKRGEANSEQAAIGIQLARALMEKHAK